MIEIVAGALDRTGFLGLALLMFVENVFPPIPSELVMPMGGFAAARGDMSLPGVALAGSAGSLAGALFWYGIGRWIGCAPSPGAMAPGSRSAPRRSTPPRLGSIATGGRRFWSGGLAAAGFVLQDQYLSGSHWINPLANLMIGAMVFAYIVRLVRTRRRTRTPGPDRR